MLSSKNMIVMLNCCLSNCPVAFSAPKTVAKLVYIPMFMEEGIVTF